MDFGAALAALKAGKRVTRRHWNGPGQWVALQVPDADSTMGHPYLFLSPVDRLLVPWTPSQTDLLAEDWSEVR